MSGTQQYRNGSTEGGTLLWIYGTGFAPNAFSTEPSTARSNTIQLIRGNDTYDCEGSIERVTDTQLACYTPPMSPVVTDISSDSGSIEGGTILTINGEYFSESNQYPLAVNVGDESCNIISSELTFIQCQTSTTPVNNRNHYRGGRGLHIFYQPGFTSLTSLGNANPPMPSATANRTWTGEASFSSNFPSGATVWFIGFLRTPMTAAFNFRLETNSQAILYLSSDEDPTNKAQIATNSAPNSNRIVLQNNTDYYMLCVGSTSMGNFRLEIKTAMQPLNARTGMSSFGTSEIQRITIGAPVTNEQQRIVYMTNLATAGVAEVQDVEAVFEIFQIGFEGVYTGLLDGPPPPQDIQDALNDLPTIFPLSVTVVLVGTAYRVTFPVEMGDVSPFTVISAAYNQTQRATEIVQGIPSNSKIAFQLDGATTSYLNFRDDNITDAILRDEFMNLFNIRCPPSLNNPLTTPSIVYTEEFEVTGSFDESFDIKDMAFCGRGALRNSSQNLIYGNTLIADYMCFAYKIVIGGSITINFLIENDGNPPVLENIPMNLRADSRWHYTCINLRDTLEQYSFMYLTVTSFVILQANLSYFAPLTIMIDTVTLRNTLPIGYEDDNMIMSTDQSSIGPCTFPFFYNGKNHSSCVLDDYNLPICGLTSNRRFYCQNSSIEGVRRLYPKYQLLDNSFQANHIPSNSTIDISFRYTACMSPSLVKVLPPAVGQVISIRNASKPVRGYYSIMFDGQIYSPIPVAISGPNLANVLQSFSDFGYVNVSRTGECYQYAYTIQWLVNGEQPLISITNSSQVTPINTPMIVSSIQRGSTINVFYNLPNDILRTYHMTPQVEVLVGGYPSYCSKENNSCEFQRSISDTPQITSVEQNGTTVTIRGTGFSMNFESNMISIGESGSCTVQAVSVTSIQCTIINAPSGRHILQLNVADKGLASSNDIYMVNVPLFITSFEPNGGDSGGGYTLTVVGGGFSSNALITLGENFCINVIVISFTTIQCIVPPSSSGSLTQVRVTVIDSTNSAMATVQFTYNVTIAPTIHSINPTYVTMSSGLLEINGTGFGNRDISVFVDTKNARVLASSNNHILVSLSTLPPGLYPITVRTSMGFARPLFHIEYRFYIQQISPQVGSAYGGTDIYLNGKGFENGTRIQLRDRNNRIAPCNILSVQSNQIHCRITSPSRQVTITSYGTHPTYGFGYSWFPIRETVQQGTIVTWYWDSTQLLSPVYYKVQQVANAYSTTPVPSGFDSGPVTSSGSFSHQFDTLGTFYYWAPNVHQSSGYSMRGTIDVVVRESETMTVEAVWDKFTAQTCTFPFIFNSVNYTACTPANDTQLWCSPTPIYTGQRLYCTPTVPIPNPSCSWTTLNVSSCSESIPTSSNPTQFLSTTCTIESITGISPTEGTVGTELTITGTRFSGNMCDYDIQIGTSYHCPIINMSSTELLCQITTYSMLDPRTDHIVRVARYRQGYLANQNQMRFRFLPSISNITPMIGSIYGGTHVTIDGEGFISDDTLVFIGGTNYTHRGSVSYSQIIFITPPELTYVNLNINVFVYVRTSQSVCLMPSCHFSWATSVTPYFNSVNPLHIRGTMNLTITGQNLISGGTTLANVHVNIHDNACNITQMSNNSIACTVSGIEAGEHRIDAFVDGIGNVYSLLNITSDAVVSTVTPVSSSVHGGATLTIDGHGFSNNASEIQITIGSNSCPVIEAIESRIECTIPPQGSSSNTANISISSHQISFPSSFILNYNNTITPNITSVSPTFGSNSQVLVITGHNFVGTGQTDVTVGDTPCNITTRSMGSITCTVGSSLSAGNHTINVHVDDIGDSNEDIVYRHDLSITSITPSEGGYGGGISSTIRGNGFKGTDVDVNVCNKSCLSIQIESNDQLTCVTPPISMASMNTVCNMTVDVDGIRKNTVFTYKINLTATVTSVSPSRGGTGGGTTITINGTDFPTSINAVTVTINDIPCSVQTVTTTSITCETGSHRYSSVRAPIMVSINGSGYAIGSVYFQYIDLWSSPWTWGGDEPPEAGTLVVIENQETIYLDIETPILKVLVIDNATLIFDDFQDVALNVEYIVIVNGGRLAVGTESNPFQHRGVINMYGHLRSIELPIYGAKVLAIREGTLDMHGIPTIRTWTRLGATASNGSSAITLLQPVNWTIDSQIVIATTSDRFSQKESEIRRIKNISSNGLILTLDKPLTYTHLGITQMLNSTTVEIRGEVGLLSHNVIFQGSITETWDEIIEACPAGFNPDEFAVQTCFLGRYGQEIGSDQFGAMIMVSQDDNITNSSQRVAVRLSNVEVFHVGQAFRLDRYAIHFQRNGNMSESYVKSSSIHESFNRAIHIQASNYITIEDNVIYNIMGNAMFLSDGIEVGHVFRGNLAIFVRTSSSLLNEDLTPAAFWLSNPNNFVEFNAVAGTTHYGYWYRFDNKPEGFSLQTYPDYCPNRQPFGSFYNNSVHSTGRFGVWIYPEYAPTMFGDCNGTYPTQATIEGLIAWKNNKGIEVVMSRTIQIKNALVFDNADMGIAYITAVGHQETNPPYLRPTFYDDLNGSLVVDSIIIGDVGISPTPIIPKTAGLVVMWDRGLRVRNVVFMNFPSNETRAIYGPIILDRCTDRCGGWLTYFSNISFIDVTVRGKFRWAYDALYYDEDGSLTGQSDSVIMAPDGLTNTSLTCTLVSTFENAIQCPRSQGAWLRFSFREILERPLGRLFIDNDMNSTTIVPWLREQLTYPNGYLVVLQANQSYILRFETTITSQQMRYTGVVYDVAPGDYLIIQHHMNVAPYKANTTIDRQMILGSITPLSASTSTNGDWYYDGVTSLFSYIILNPLTANASVDIELSYQVYICPCNSCGCPVTTTTTTTTTTATTASTTSATTATTTTATTSTTTSATTSTSTSATTETTTSATTTTTTSATTTTSTTSTTATRTTTTTTMYLPPIQPCNELPTSPQVCQSIDIKYWSVDSHWTFGPQDYINWIGVKPDHDNNIFVPRCIWLIIDYPLPRIRALRIDGVVEFQQGRNHIMYVDNIIINGGRLIAGLPNAPFNGNVDIIMKNSGPITIQLPQNYPILVPKMISVLGGIDLHGISHRITWTRLAMTAVPGQNIITLSQSVNWVVGDEIIITTTDTNISHTERHRIVNIQNATVIYTATPLAYTHLVIQHTFVNGRVINVAAAVGLLTRNVRIINQNSGSSLSGFRIFMTEYQTDVWHIYSSRYYSTCYRGYARISNTQFIGFGQLDDSYNTDQRSGIYMSRLGDYNPNRATFINASSFDSGFNAAISMLGTNGISIANNVIYNTYRSGLVVTGTNNIIQNNLVTTVYWLGTGQIPSVAEFNFNNDGAIMSRDVNSVRLLDNMVAGVERLAYRIHGESCGGSDIYVPPNITNEYWNNEAHSAMSGVNVLPVDKGFIYDRKCVLIKGFKVYKAWYYGFYINSPRNITISSCSSIDSHVGIFTYILGPSALSHVSIASRVNINDSIVIGSITSQDCNDKIDSNSINIRLSQMAIPGVSDNSSFNITAGRVGIVFPTVSRNNFMPIRSWTGIGIYPCLNGSMSIINTTFAFFNDTCGRHDVAIQVSQRNDDGQFPITTRSLFVYNTSEENLIFNGLPNLGVVNPSRCGDMDCDGLKKNLLVDTDGSLFGQPASVFSYAEALWGNQQHGIGDFRIPLVAYTNLTGHRMNINLTHPYRGISRTNSCSLRSSWGMYICNSTTDYRMLIIESMDSDTEKRRLSPVAIMSKSGYIDLINGPQDQTFCNGYSCRKRISTFMAIIQSEQTYDIYFSSTPPRQTRFRILNANSSIKCILALYFYSLQQIDFYANTLYVPPTNRDLRSPGLMLLDQPNNVTLLSPPGSNYFNSRIRRQASSITAPVRLQMELRDEPRPSTTAATGIRAEILANIASSIINRYQAGELQIAWANLNIAGGNSPSNLSTQEPYDDFQVELSVIRQLLLITPPSNCRQQSPCTIQPVLVAYDVQGNVIQKLGSNDRPWQVKASLVNQPNVMLPGNIANYTNGQTQYSLLTLPDNGTYEVQFTMILPDGVNSTYFWTLNLTAQTTNCTVTQAVLAGRQVNNVYVVNVNETFSISVMPIDSVTRLRLGQIQWGGWQWSANVNMYSLPSFNRLGSLVRNSTSRTVINLVAGTVTITNLALNFTGATGTIVALFEVEPLATNVSNAVSSLLSNPNTISGLTISSLNINGRSYSVSDLSNHNETNNTDNGSTNVGLIVGLVVGLVGGSLIVAGIVLVYQLYPRMLVQNRLGVTETIGQQPISNTALTVSDVELISFSPASYAPSAPNQIHVSKYVYPSQPQLPTSKPNAPNFKKAEPGQSPLAPTLISFN
ncbi:unnamed protein product [Rotaria sordida]|uniref:Fibrocystin-L n=1 Tax=Rotaria sordida TaxID=392033 RepID=A0A818MWP6_9BILA|nr:unnamed protein product [Rotaria sordida]